MPADVLKLLSAASRPEPRPAPDADLLARFVSSCDEAAFAELVRRHGPAVYRACKHLLGSSSADDAFQATFLVLACRAKSVRKTGSVGSWLIGVAGRVSRQMRKSHRRAAGVSRLRDENDGGKGEQGGAHLPRSPELAELATILNEELSRLPDSLRGPVVMCLVEGQTQEQAAAALGGSIRTLRRRLDRAKALLRLRLERRGVVPTVAAGLVASLGTGTAALPPGLAGRTVNGVFAFLTGGRADTPAAFVAKGVVGSMARIKVSALMTATAAVMIGLGVGWAGDGPPPAAPPASPPATPPKAAAEARTPPPQEQPARQEVKAWSANFAVSAPTAVVARAIANEAEYQRKALAERWLGKELPAWPKQCEIKVTTEPGPGQGGGSGTYIIASSANGMHMLFGTQLSMHLRGPLELLLSRHLPREVAHATLASPFPGRSVPRWVDEGVALATEVPEEQAGSDARFRKILAEGRCPRLRVLLTKYDYPDWNVTALQGHSIVRFLLAYPGRNQVRVVGNIPVLGWVFKIGPEERHQRLMAFVALGMEGKGPEAWNRAAKQVYGIESVDDLEAAWLDWLNKPESKLGGQPTPPAPKPADPNLIPPTPLPGGEGKLPDDVIRVTSRTQTFPIKPGLGREKNAKEVHLYVSRDRGATWQKQAIAPPDQAAFVFEAPADGLYWLSVVLVTKDGRTIPADLSRLEPLQKIVVDTGGGGKR